MLRVERELNEHADIRITILSQVDSVYFSLIAFRNCSER